MWAWQPGGVFFVIFGPIAIYVGAAYLIAGAVELGQWIVALF